jgi:uncharacterized protein
MSRRSIPGVVASFDALRLAASRGSIEGTLDACSLPRLADLMLDEVDTAPIAFRIEGGTDAERRGALTVAIDGVLPLTCQRCLGRLDWPVAQRTELLLARDAAELARLDAETEAEVILADAPLEPAALVEDELLLTVPYAPRHEGNCPV